MDQNIDNHQLYNDAYKDFMTYFTASKERLQSNSSHTGELDELESRLKTVKVCTQVCDEIKRTFQNSEEYFLRCPNVNKEVFL